MSTLATPQTSATTWNIDPAHSVAEFKVKHMMISNVKGQFPRLTGALTLDESDGRTPAWRHRSTRPRSPPATPSATLTLRARLSGRGEVPYVVLQITRVVRTCRRRRIGRRRRPDHSRRHPQSGVSRSKDRLAAAKDPWGNTRVALSATTKINRKDFGLTWNATLETGGIPGRRRSNHHARRAVRKGLSEFAAAHTFSRE